MICKKDYEGFEIDFEPFIRQRNVMVNATQMAKIFEKRVDHFLKSDHANEFIKELEFTPFGGNSSPLIRDEIIQTRGQSGTWMHRILALKFAAWLNPKFELWVFMTIEELLFGFANTQTKSIQRTVQLKNRIYQLKEKEDKTGEDFVEYLQCLEDLASERHTRGDISKEKFREAWDLFNQPKLEDLSRN